MREALKKGRRHLSRIIDAGERSEIGRYDFESSAGLPGFGTGKTTAFFHIDGSSAFWTDRLKSLVRYVRAFLPKCLRWSMVMSSGPVAVEFLARLMAEMTSSSEIGLKFGSSLVFLIFRMKILLFCWILRRWRRRKRVRVE